MVLRKILIMIAGAGLISGLAQAQLSSDGGPIYTDAENIETRDTERQVILTGEVDIQQGSSRMRADRVVIQFAGRSGEGTGIASGFGSIRTMTANGDVFYVTPELKAKGDQGKYNAVSETIVLDGNVALTRDQDVARGNSLTIEVASGKTTLDGGSGRVQAIIQPEGN